MLLNICLVVLFLKIETSIASEISITLCQYLRFKVSFAKLTYLFYHDGDSASITNTDNMAAGVTNPSSPSLGGSELFEVYYLLNCLLCRLPLYIEPALTNQTNKL